MLKRFLVVALFLCVGIIGPAAQAAAMSISDTITLHGVVPTARYIYLDSSGNIAKVVGNTSDNSIVPVIVTPALTPASQNRHIMGQYQQILEQNDNYLAAGQTYYPVSTGPYAQFANWLLSNPYFSLKPY